MKKIQKILMISFVGYILFALLIVLAYESGLQAQGDFADDKVTQFWLQIVMEFITICIIPLALRFFKFKFVVETIKKEREKSLLRWGIVRMDMLCIPMVANAWIYELTLSPGFGYMAIILFICLFFITPTVKRCEKEGNIEA